MLKKGFFWNSIIIDIKIFEVIKDVCALNLEGVSTMICSMCFLWNELANFSMTVFCWCNDRDNSWGWGDTKKNAI